MRSPKGETGVIRDIDIRSLANDASFTRGSRYYNNSQVVELQQKPLDERCYTAKVQGSSAAAYEVEVELTQDRCHVSDYCCDCPAALRLAKPQPLEPLWPALQPCRPDWRLL